MRSFSYRLFQLDAAALTLSLSKGEGCPIVGRENASYFDRLNMRLVLIPIVNVRPGGELGPGVEGGRALQHLGRA